MKNITVSVDDETYRLARIVAAEQDTSVSAMVKAFLSDVATGGSKFERLKKQEATLRASIRSFRAERVSREELHRRG